MIRSMTGFGSSSRVTNGYRLQVDAKSVNHRYSEIAVRLPREWLCYEDALKKTAQQFIRRGRVDIFASGAYESASGEGMQVNWALAEAYREAAGQLQSRYGLTDGLTLGQLLAVPEIVQLRPSEPEPAEWLEAELNECLRQSLLKLAAMREAEGAALYDDLVVRMRFVDGQRAEIVRLAPAAVRDYRDKLYARMQELLDGKAEPDENRLLTEVALFAERIGIDEELTRLASHLGQFASLLELDEPVGRKLDFLIQEMNREVNTIGSKANHAGIVARVVEIKAELEKICEQVQNIE